MKMTALGWVVLVAFFTVLATGSGGAQSQPVHFEGGIHDHTTATFGSWEIHGTWALNLTGASGKGEFTAALSMERGDLWFVSPGGNPNDLAARNSHTHHIAVTDGAITPIANGFRLTGTARATGNGATPPFGTSSSLQVDVTGGDLVGYSNIALTFSGDAAKHFGTNPIAGVVSGIK